MRPSSPGCPHRRTPPSAPRGWAVRTTNDPAGTIRVQVSGRLSDDKISGTFKVTVYPKKGKSESVTGTFDEVTEAPADGYLDGYHLGYLHRNSIGAKSITNRNTYDLYGPHVRIGFANKPILDQRDVPPEEWPDKYECFSLVHYVFPNISISGHPDKSLMVSRIFPGPGVGESTGSATLYLLPAQGCEPLFHLPDSDLRVLRDVPGQQSTVADQVDETRHSLVLTLPRAELFSVALDNQETYVYARTTHALARHNPGLESKARSLAEQMLKQSALDSDLVETAERNAEQVLRALLESVGYVNVEIRWHARSLPGAAGRTQRRIRQSG